MAAIPTAHHGEGEPAGDTGFCHHRALPERSQPPRMTGTPRCATTPATAAERSGPNSLSKRAAGRGIGAMDADATRKQLAAALARVAAGDRAALRIVYQDTSAKLFGVCLRILKDRSEAEDVLQDVYVTVW